MVDRLPGGRENIPSLMHKIFYKIRISLILLVNRIHDSYSTVCPNEINYIYLVPELTCPTMHKSNATKKWHSTLPFSFLGLKLLMFNRKQFIEFIKSGIWWRFERSDLQFLTESTDLSGQLEKSNSNFNLKSR